MSLTINLICFDINYSNNTLEINEENFFRLFYNKDFSSPLNLIKNFLYNNKKAKIKNLKKSNSYISIAFWFQINEKKKIIFNIIIIHDFSRIYNLCLASDGYIIFFDLENKKYKENLNNIIEYIKESCDIETRTHIIRVHKDKNFENDEIISINKYLENKNIKFSFYQMNLNNDKENNINELNEEDEIEENEETIITFEGFIKKIYHEKIRQFKEFSKYNDSNSTSGTSKCLIY